MIRLLILLMFLPGAALACACCADRGEHRVLIVPRGDWVTSELEALVTGPEARMSLTPCGMDCISGIANPQERYLVAMEMAGGEAVFTFSDAAGLVRGTLSFELPEEYVSFDVDLDPMSDATTVELYKELRFLGALRGDGDFAITAPAVAELVLSGRGNQCFDASGFQNWRLDARGDAVSYRLLGSFETR